MVKLWTTSANPPTAIFWRGWDQRLINFSAGYTFEVRLAKDTAPTVTVVTKTTDITGAVGDLTAVPQVPNVTIGWDVGDLSAITSSGLYIVQVAAFQGPRPRYMTFMADVKVALS